MCNRWRLQLDQNMNVTRQQRACYQQSRADEHERSNLFLSMDDRDNVAEDSDMMMT
jgi:hypothetical protein